MPSIDQIVKILKKPYSSVIAPLFFPGSQRYWEERYASGNNSGSGSYGKLAEFKAEIINAFVAEHSIHKVIEFGCGDGNQLTLAQYPAYIGYDVSSSAIELCREKFHNKPNMHFHLLDEYHGETCDLAMSLDVIYHLVEDSVYEDHMKKLFSSSTKYVIIYSSNHESFPEKAAHIQPRKFTDWVEHKKPDWTQIRFIPNRYPYDPQDNSGSPADFYIFQKNGVE